MDRSFEQHISKEIAGIVKLINEINTMLAIQRLKRIRARFLRKKLGIKNIYFFPDNTFAQYRWN